MKKIAVVLVLIISTNSYLYAQKKNSDKLFDIPSNEIQRIFYIDLDKGDQIKLELENMNDLDAIGNLDSVLRVFIRDIEPLKDSLGDDLSSKRIDYILDPSGKNKLRIQIFAATGSSYLVNQGTIAAMKLEQDTVNIIVKANGAPAQLFRKTTPGFHYYKISFFVNNLANLAGYMNGRMQSSIDKLKANATKKWVNGKDERWHLKSDAGISSNLPRGQVSGSDYLMLRLTADIQNYKNYFVPSLSIAAIIITNRNLVKREYSFTGESHFTFAKNADGKLQTFRNSFLTLGFSQTNTSKQKSMLGYAPSFSIGWLARKRGNVYDKNTFRIGFGKASLFDGVLKVEPVFYFHDFFKGITPGIRLSL